MRGLRTPWCIDTSSSGHTTQREKRAFWEVSLAGHRRRSHPCRPRGLHRCAPPAPVDAVAPPTPWALLCWRRGQRARRKRVGSPPAGSNGWSGGGMRVQGAGGCGGGQWRRRWPPRSPPAEPPSTLRRERGGAGGGRRGARGGGKGGGAATAARPLVIPSGAGARASRAGRRCRGGRGRGGGERAASASSAVAPRSPPATARATSRSSALARRAAGWPCRPSGGFSNGGSAPPSKGHAPTGGGGRVWSGH